MHSRRTKLMMCWKKIPFHLLKLDWNLYKKCWEVFWKLLSDFNMTCPPRANAFEHRFPSCWCCLGRLWRVPGGSPSLGLILAVLWASLTSYLLSVSSQCVQYGQQPPNPMAVFSLPWWNRSPQMIMQNKFFLQLLLPGALVSLNCHHPIAPNHLKKGTIK